MYVIEQNLFFARPNYKINNNDKELFKSNSFANFISIY